MTRTRVAKVTERPPETLDGNPSHPLTKRETIDNLKLSAAALSGRDCYGLLVTIDLLERELEPDPVVDLVIPTRDLPVATSFPNTSLPIYPYFSTSR